jgi:hypothetical protein
MASEGGMPKKQHRRKRRSAPRLHHAGPDSAPARARARGEPDLLADVRRMLGQSHPAELLHFASSLLAVTDPRADDPFARVHGAPSKAVTGADLVGSFIEVRVRETTALLTALAQMVDDDLVARRIRRELARRDDRLPPWLTRLAPVSVDRAVLMGHVLGDGDNIMVAARTEAGHHLTAIVYIDHNLGTVAKDGFVVHEPIGRALASFRTAARQDPDVVFDELPLADARARITEAIDLGAVTVPPFETDTWPAARPLVEWIVRHLPDGGRGHERREWSDEDRRALTEEFLASEFGRDHDRGDREVLELLLSFGCNYGPGDPLRWSPVAVEILLTDWLPRKVIADAEFLGRAPDLLRSLIHFSHARRGIRAALTEETLSAVDRWEPGYRRAIAEPRPQGPSALLAAMGVLDDLPSYEDQMLDALRDAVGADALDDLDTSPLADEPLDLSQVPPDVHDRVNDVAELVDACCAELLDVEHRTACRRLLGDVAAADPSIFRRRGRPETAAAAIVWIVAKANRALSQRPGGLTAKAVGEWFDVGSNPGQRAPTLLKAIDAPGRYFADVRLGTPRYLVADRRRGIAETRDRYRPPS